MRNELRLKNSVHRVFSLKTLSASGDLPRGAFNIIWKGRIFIMILGSASLSPHEWSCRCAPSSAQWQPKLFSLKTSSRDWELSVRCLPDSGTALLGDSEQVIPPLWPYTHFTYRESKEADTTLVKTFKFMNKKCHIRVEYRSSSLSEHIYFFTYRDPGN